MRHRTIKDFGQAGDGGLRRQTFRGGVRFHAPLAITEWLSGQAGQTTLLESRDGEAT